MKPMFVAFSDFWSTEHQRPNEEVEIFPHHLAHPGFAINWYVDSTSRIGLGYEAIVDGICWFYPLVI